MIIKILLSVGLFLPLSYVLVQRNPARLIRLSIIAAVVVGEYFVWLPNQTNSIAHFVGVGRGADLIMYCWILVSMLLILNNIFGNRSTNQNLIKLARRIALYEARNDADNRAKLGV